MWEGIRKFCEHICIRALAAACSSLTPRYGEMELELLALA